jgi:amino acid adenylation domain-containing protein
VSPTASRSLTRREVEVLELIAQGLTNSEVARRLDVTVHAVKFHLASIYKKLGVANRTEAAYTYFQHPNAEPAPGSPENGDRPAVDGPRRAQSLAEPRPLDLPGNAARLREGGLAGREDRALSGELAAAVTAFAERQGVEVHTVVLAALAAVLRRYTRQEDIVLGTPSGLVWLDVAGNPSFGELVARVDCELASADRGDANGFRPQVVFAEELLTPDPACDLAIAVDERADERAVVCVFDRGMFSSPMVERMLGHLLTLLAAGVATPSCPVGALELLTPEERQRQLRDWNATEQPFPDRRTEELIGERAALQPNAVAVAFEGQSLTYAELDARANALGHLLQELGVGPGVLVAICVERSLDMLVGLLGIMRAGGAYVPVDPSFPLDRQRFMIEDAGVPVIVTQERLRSQLPDHHGAVVCLDDTAEWMAGRPTTLPPSTATPDDLAYVIYTSGSTGTPKGVQIPHRALVNFLTTMGERPGMTADDVLVAVTTLSFDIAGLELYLPLVTGGRVVIAPQTTAADPRRLAELIESSNATVVQATPTTWRMLVDSGWPGRPGLKVLCGGEALPTVLAEELVARELELWNMYGPTETTIWSAISRVRTGEALSLGHPIANTTVYILDEALQPAPIGVPGELHIGGDGLARGYLNRPELTAERFVPHPFDPSEGRIYKTGDLARQDENGNLEFLGRLDHQVKVRGYRIELGEIETALSRCPGVATAVAITREDVPGDVRLVGYVVPTDDAAVSEGDLRRRLADSLPPYMVPSAIVTLRDLPLTPNGKIDRKRLPEPAAERTRGDSFVAPRTPLERRLVEIWEQDLGVAPIGVTDDFFDLGVTSIVAARLFARLERELGGRLPLGAVFQAPTIEKLAFLVESDDSTGRWTSLVPIQPNGSEPPLFCVHGGAGTVLHLQPLAQLLGPEQPFYGLQARGLYGGAPPLLSVEEMAEHYLDELRTVQPEGPYYISGYCFGAIVAFEIAQRLLREGEVVGLLAMFNGPSPTWIRRYGGISRQPSKLAARTVPPPPPPLTRRVAGVLTNPKKMRGWARHLRWRFRNRFIDPARVRKSMRLNLPLPEEVREIYFLEIAARAEYAYEPERYPGPIIVFHGEGLYDDPDLGWIDLASSIETVAVPGDHSGNRDMMAEPPVTVVAERMHEALVTARASLQAPRPAERLPAA